MPQGGALLEEGEEVNGLLSVDPFSMPASAGPSDRFVGMSEYGTPMMETPTGQRYTVRPQAERMTQQPEPRPEPQGLLSYGDARRAARSAPGAIRQGDTGVIGGLLGAMVQGLTAPGRAARGEPVTLGDAWATALDWGSMTPLGAAPKDAVRAGWGRNDPKIGQGFEDWMDELYSAEVRAARRSGDAPPVIQPDTYWRGVSPEEMAQAEAAGAFNANNAGVFVADDPTRYIGGGAYGAKRQGSILQFDTHGMETIPMRGGIGTGDDFGFQSIPMNRVQRIWDWDEALGQHVLRGEPQQPSSNPKQKLTIEDLRENVRKRRAERERISQMLLQDDKAVRMTDGRLKAIVSPAADRPGKWRVTYLDEKGPMGHTDAEDKADAVAKALERQFWPEALPQQPKGLLE